MSSIFYGCSNLSYLPDISKWNTKNVTDMSSIFYGCSKLSYLPDISKWNTNNITDMSSIFYGCSNLSYLPDISKWNTNNVIDMSFMFLDCFSSKRLSNLSWNLNYFNSLKNIDEIFDKYSSMEESKEYKLFERTNNFYIKSIFKELYSLENIQERIDNEDFPNPESDEFLKKNILNKFLKAFNIFNHFNLLISLDFYM